MANSWADLVLHPVRIRILRALGRNTRTTRDLVAALPHVPQASLYRHLATLVGGGVIDVVEERKVRGTLERVYALPTKGAILDAAGMTPEEHSRAFTAFVSTLLSDFGRYLDRDRVDFAADGVGYQEVVLHLDDEEFTEFAGGVAELVRPLLDKEPREGRTPRLLATVLMPVDEPDTERK